MTLLLVVLPLVAGSACLGAMRVGPDGGRLQTGTWGGEHVAMTVTDAGAHLEFDCASGDITEPLVVDDGGQLASQGVFVREHGGPVRVGEEPDRTPARYSGRLTDKTLTLDVTLVDSNESIGSFTLSYGAEPRVRKCL